MQPVSRRDWQLAVDAAHAVQSIEAARQYGLVIGGPEVDLLRCAEILERGAALGFTPDPRAAERYVAEWNAEARRLLDGLKWSEGDGAETPATL